MDRKIKLIWDFKGQDALEVAKHHCIHLKEFASIDELSHYGIDIVVVNDFFVKAYIVVSEQDMLVYRDALKPHRGELF